MSTPWNHNITWLASSKRARSGAASSRSQSKQRRQSTERPEEDADDHDVEPTFDLKEVITAMTAYALNNTVSTGDVVGALDYAATHPTYLLDLSHCVARNSTRLLRSLHTALTSNYPQAVRIYTSIVETVLEFGGPQGDSSVSSFSTTPALLSALLHESENVKLLMWVVEDSVTKLLGTEHILDVILSRNENERFNEVRVATPQTDVLDAIHRLLCGVIIPLISSCGAGPTSSHGVLETQLKGELVKAGMFQVLFNTIDYCNLWLAGSARFVKDGIKTVDDILSGPSASASPLTEDSKLIETFRLGPQGGGSPSTVVGSLLRLGRTSATALIHLLKASKETKKIFVGSVADSPSYALRAVAGVYHASDSYLQLQLCEGLVRGYAFDRNTFQHTTLPHDKAFLEVHCKGASTNHLIAFVDALSLGIASLPSDASLIPQCRRLLRNLEDRQRGGEGSPLRRAAGSGGSNHLAEVPPLTATFDVLRVEFGVDNDSATSTTTTTTTASQRGGELFLAGDDEDDSSSTNHANAETTTVVFSPMFFLLRPPTTAPSDAPAPNPFTIPHDRITSVKLTRDRRFGFKLTPSAFEGRVLAEDRKAGLEGGVHPNALLYDSSIVSNLITTVTNANGGNVGGGEADSSDLLRLFLYMQRCDMKIRPSLYRQQEAAPSASFMLYLCTTSATITAITSSNLQVWIKRAKAAYTSTTITAPDPPLPAAVEAVTNPIAAIGRNQALSFVGGDRGDGYDRRSSRLLPPSTTSSVAPLDGDRRSMGSATSSNNLGRGSVQSHDPDMFGDHHYRNSQPHLITPTSSSLPLRGVVASASDAVSAANEAGKYKSRLAVVERYRELIEARTAQYKLNHRLRRQEFEEVIVKPVFENVLNGSLSDGTVRITTTTHGGSTTQQESTLSGFDADIKSTVLALNEQLEGIEAVGDSIVDVIHKLKEEYGDGVDVVERRRKSLQGTKHDTDAEDDVAIEREMLSPIQRKHRNSTVLRDIVKSMEKQALEAIKERVERKLGGLEVQMKEVLERRCALEDPSPVIRSFAARQRALDGEDNQPQDRRRRTSKV